MSENSNIAWTTHTWNPWRGCTKVDPGCKNCYMFTAQARYGKDPSVVVRTKTWGDPIKWNHAAADEVTRPMVFTCSWSDWFHADADAWRSEAWALVKSCPNLIFQILTKRADRIADNLPADWGDGYRNVWLGVSISESKGAWRERELSKIPAYMRFISYEPALGPILGAVNLDEIDWLIYGGESGPGFRAEDKQWARDMRRECLMSGVAFFHKQSSGAKPETGIELDGEIVREFPNVI